jgi:hypothetical protein
LVNNKTMNSEIKRLLLQIVPMAGEDGEYLPSLHTSQDIEKFVELTVQECIDYCGENLSKTVGGALKIHFGIE